LEYAKKTLLILFREVPAGLVDLGMTPDIMDAFIRGYLEETARMIIEYTGKTNYQSQTLNIANKFVNKFGKNPSSLEGLPKEINELTATTMESSTEVSERMDKILDKYMKRLFSN
jgi:hypothetical protein